MNTAEKIKASEGEPSQWPKIVLEYDGDPAFPPFESGRDQLLPPAEEPLK